MKKLATIIIVFVYALPTNAQINKGGKIIGGSMDFTMIANKTDSAKVSSESAIISPIFGVYVSPKTALGLNIDYKVTDQTRRTIHVNTFIKHNKQISEKFYAFSRFDFDVIPNRKEGNSKLFSLGFNFSPGIEYFFNKNWALTSSIASFSVRYNKNTPDNNNVSGSEKTTVLNAKYNFFSGIGLIYYWQKAK